MQMINNDGSANDYLGGQAMHELQKLFVDENFIELERVLNKFNVFDVLKITDYEIRHTVFLSYLLDPQGSHGLGERFLHNFLLRLALSSPARCFDLEDLDLQLAQITPELFLKNATTSSAARPSRSDGDRKLDIFLQIPQRSKRGQDLVIAIENKINAKESADQLISYRTWIEANRANHDLVYVFLTLAGDEPGDSAWIPVTYSNVVYPALVDASGAMEGRLAPAPLTLISDYLALLSNRVEEEAATATLDDAAADILKAHPKVQKTMAYLCNRWRPESRRMDQNITPDWALYCRHGKAFDFLSRYNTDPRSSALKWFRAEWQEIAAKGDLQVQIDDSNRAYYRFLPAAKNSSLDQLVKTFGYQSRDNEKFKWTTSQRALLFEIRAYNVDESNTKWVLFVVVGPLSVPDREHFVGFLKNAMTNGRNQVSQANGRSLELMGRKITDSYTAILRYELGARNFKEFVCEISEPQFLTVLRESAQTLTSALELYVPPMSEDASAGA